jgi:hypothetical protein
MSPSTKVSGAPTRAHPVGTPPLVTAYIPTDRAGDELARRHPPSDVTAFASGANTSGPDNTSRSGVRPSSTDAVDNSSRQRDHLRFNRACAKGDSA